MVCGLYVRIYQRHCAAFVKAAILSTTPLLVMMLLLYHVFYSLKKIIDREERTVYGVLLASEKSNTV